jgi:hypothetical protein
MRRISGMALLLGLVVFCGILRADEEAPPADYSRITRDGLSVFVMLAPGKWAQRNPTLRARYTQSGLYPYTVVAKPPKPRWTVDWYASMVHLSRDGRYVIRYGRWEAWYDGLAIGFYDSGRLTRAYSVADLVSCPDALTHTISHFFWLQHSPMFDVGDSEVPIVTLTLEEYLFDFKTGRVIKYNSILESVGKSFEAPISPAPMIEDFHALAARINTMCPDKLRAPNKRYLTPVGPVSPLPEQSDVQRLQPYLIAHRSDLGFCRGSSPESACQERAVRAFRDALAECSQPSKRCQELPATQASRNYHRGESTPESNCGLGSDNGWAVRGSRHGVSDAAFERDLPEASRRSLSR